MRQIAKITLLALSMGSLLCQGAWTEVVTSEAEVLDQPVGMLYVSSPKPQDTLVPQLYTRENASHATEYKSKVVIGYADYRIALAYSYNRPQTGSYLGIDLKTPTPMSEPVTVYVHGGKNLEEALDRLYGNTPEDEAGYIYTLEATHFRHEKGLASKEAVSHQSFSHPLGIKINRRAEIDRLVKENQLRLVFKNS